MKGLAAAITSLTVIVGAVFGVQQYVEARVEERVVEAETKAGSAVRLSQAVHVLDVYETKADMAEKTLDLLRAIGADQHKIEAAEKELDFWKGEAHKARQGLIQ